MSRPTEHYRPDIDGLRSLAVGAVVLFHAFPRLLPGGFVGVDIFFVISGYLITGILLDGLASGRFTFYEFYARRVRRIFPALILVLGACLAFSWLAGLPNEHEQLGKHVAGGAGFVANLVLLSEISYFDPAAATKPLLHLWSLGVEEQFYLFWPALLYLTRRSARATLVGIVAITTISLALNITLVGTHPEQAFYLPFTRFWELMAGSLLAFHQRRARAQPGEARAGAGTNLIGWSGLLLIIASIAMLDESAPFPGWRALPVVIGTSMLVWAGPAATVNRKLFSHPVAVYVGLISYPLYLWHWPLLVYLRQCVPQASALSAALMLVLAFALAAATYHLVESQFSKRSVRGSGRWMIAGLGMAATLIAAIGLASWAGRIEPLTARDPKLVTISDAIIDVAEPGGVQRFQGNTTAPITLFVGDSYMKHYLPRVRRFLATADRPTRGAEFHTRGGCNAVLRLEQIRRADCADFIATAYRRAMDPDVGVVVIGAAWRQLQIHDDYYFVDQGPATAGPLLPVRRAEFLRRLEDELRALTRARKTVYLLTSLPFSKAFDPRRMLDRTHIPPVAHMAASIPRAEALYETVQLDADLRRVAESTGAYWVDPADWICDRQNCRSVDSTGRPISPDGAHLRPSFVARELVQLDEFVTLPKPATPPPADASGPGSHP